MTVGCAVHVAKQCADIVNHSERGGGGTADDYCYGGRGQVRSDKKCLITSTCVEEAGLYYAYFSSLPFESDLGDDMVI